MDNMPTKLRAWSSDVHVDTWSRFQHGGWDHDLAQTGISRLWSQRWQQRSGNCGCGRREQRRFCREQCGDPQQEVASPPPTELASVGCVQRLAPSTGQDWPARSELSSAAPHITASERVDIASTAHEEVSLPQSLEPLALSLKIKFKDSSAQ